VRYEEVLHGTKEERNIVQTIKRRNFILIHSHVLNCIDIQTKYAVKANWVGVSRNCLLKHVIEVTGRRRRRRKPLLDKFKENTGYWRLKEEALDRTVLSSDFGRSCGPVVRPHTE
jgi:hypothetical protein